MPPSWIADDGFWSHPEPVDAVSPLESWTVLGDDSASVEPIGRYYLTDIERSPSTVKAYAQRTGFSFSLSVPDWREVPLEDVGEVGAWLPPIAGRRGRGAALGWNITVARRRNASQAILDACETFCSEGLTALLVTLPLLRFVVESSDHEAYSRGLVEL
ncbi:MAG: hypothetical protein WAN20_02135 [Pseudonocardiaceae bacterium]